MEAFFLVSDIKKEIFSFCSIFVSESDFHYMKKQLLILLILFAFQCSFSQNSKLWKGYFSYNEIKDISESPNRILAAAQNALFTKDLLSGSLRTINTIDGLAGQTITSVYYSPNFKKTLVGYENGLMIVINEVDGKMLDVVDIINKALPANIKKINHFMEYEGIVYVSCDFGIVQFNMATLQFGDTYFIGDGGAQIIVKQTAVYQGRIYAATFLNGMRSASMTNANLNDFNQWTTLDANGWVGVESLGTNLIAVSNTGFLYKWTGITFSNPVSLSQPATDVRKSGDYLVITTANHVYIYNNATLGLIRNINSTEIIDETVKFSCAAIIGDKIFIGTEENGLYTTDLLPSAFQNITPSGTLRNAVFAINASTKNLWAAYGGYNINFNPYTYFGYTPAEFGISKFNENGWSHIPYEELLGAKAISRITVNPNNANQVFFSSYYSGLLKVENEQVSMLYDARNTGSDGLQSIAGQVPDDVRINGAAFDKSGNLWVTNSLVKKGLKELKADGQWQSFNMESVYANPSLFNLIQVIVDKNGTKWIGSSHDGVIAFNETTGGVFKTLKDTPDTGNLPANDGRAIAIDKRNQLWIGTKRGLRVLPSVDNYLSESQMITEPIIFNELISGELIAQELLYQQSISDIVVDGANNKWIGTADSGVYYVSSNGQQTMYHFTTTNSPLPSDSVNDIDINPITGEVFFATNRGLVSFKGTSTSANDNLNNVYVYPNPVRPEYFGTVKVSGLMDKAHVKIADIEGNLVYEVVSEGGTIEWDTTAFSKYKVASGVYMIFVSSEDGAETKVKKVMIVR